MTNETYSKMQGPAQDRQGVGEMVDAGMESASIYACVGDAHERTSILSDTLDALISRLGPILMPETPDSDVKASSVIGGSESPLRSKMLEVERRLELLADRVRHTLHRVDL